jgi:2-octaprenyl-6-methoxyphenol hydroxylase
MTAALDDPPFDVAVVGGGMVGATLTVALSSLGLRIAVIEAVRADGAAQPSFDERTTALSNGSRRILATLGIWPSVAAAANPIAKIHVSDQGQFGFARIVAAEQGLAALGFVLPNRILGAALWARIERDSQVRIVCPAEVVEITPGADVSTLTVTGSDGVPTTIAARLVVAADGAHSAVRQAFGIGAQRRDYGQTAVITTLMPQRFHDNVAYERFTPTGPLALLPLTDGRCTVVLTLSHALAMSALTWSDADFIAEVQQRFGFRLGRFLKVGRRASYPLALVQAERTSAPRCVIIGNAAQGLHPVAGMGFNLGLRDVASLAETIAEHAGGAEVDPGAAPVLVAYDAWRRQDRRAVIAFTDGLVRLFSSRLGPLKSMRNLGLLAFDLMPPAKAALSALSTGAGGRVPKLARGVALARGAARTRDAALE